jgi:hypothetical protein
VLQLVARGLRTVGGLHHDSADARAQRAANAIRIDQMFGRARDQRIFQFGAPDLDMAL